MAECGMGFPSTPPHAFLQPLTPGVLRFFSSAALHHCQGGLLSIALDVGVPPRADRPCRHGACPCPDPRRSASHRTAPHCSPEEPCCSPGEPCCSQSR
mgnify:CR=1 FL=1